MRRHTPAPNGPHPPDEGGRGRVLAICSGNICRSPAAELLLRDRLGQLAVSSAGTIGVVGHPVEPAMARLLLADGLPPEPIAAFAARRLSEAEVASADLVLGMAAEHRSAAVQAHPQALRRSFTLVEFSALVAALPTSVTAALTAALTATAYPSGRARLQALVTAADDLRRSRRVPLPADLDVADPYGRGEAAYRQAYAAIRAALGPVVSALQEG